jgi:hypothetical protein
VWAREMAAWGLGNMMTSTKQAWRLLITPYSLCAKVLRARYYKKGSVMYAKCPKRASYTWRSILHGRDLLKEGLIWRVGDGESIEIWKDNWIPRSCLQRPLGHKPDVNVQKVKELLMPDGNGWNLNKLNNCFLRRM